MFNGDITISEKFTAWMQLANMTQEDGTPDAKALAKFLDYDEASCYAILKRTRACTKPFMLRAMNKIGFGMELFVYDRNFVEAKEDK